MNSDTWSIKRCGAWNNVPVLLHTCDGYMYVCAREASDEWSCDGCKEVAPEEVQNAARLCGCKQFSPLRKYNEQ